MQALQNEFEKLMTEVISTRLKLMKEGYEKCGITKEWMEDPENRKRGRIIESEDVDNGGFKTSFLLDDKLMFEVICRIDRKSMTVDSELRMIEQKEDNDSGSKEM